MKSLNEIRENLKAFENQFGIPVLDSLQGSDAWFKLKLGVLSASCASEIVAGKTTATRNTYMCKLVAQVCTGIVEEINGKALDWGKQTEDSARACYEFSTGATMTQLPFVYKDNKFREGCSPDGIVSPTKGVEIKCPFNTVNYIDFLANDKIKPDYLLQCQYTLRVMGAQEWDFVQYDPRMKTKPIKIMTISLDEKIQATFNDAVPQFLEDMDKMLEKCGINFGDHWKAIGARESAS